MQFLILNEDATTTPCLRIVEAESPAEALMAYRRTVWARDASFLEHIADKAVNMSFVERFWLVTDSEKKTFEETGEVTATEEMFATRLFAAFGRQRDLARQYIQYQLDPGEPNDSWLPPGLAEFVASELCGNDWSPLFVVPLTEVPVIHAGLK